VEAEKELKLLVCRSARAQSKPWGVMMICREMPLSAAVRNEQKFQALIEKTIIDDTPISSGS
jgi:hypothetical protein